MARRFISEISLLVSVPFSACGRTQTFFRAAIKGLGVAFFWGGGVVHLNLCFSEKVLDAVVVASFFSVRGVFLEARVISDAERNTQIWSARPNFFP